MDILNNQILSTLRILRERPLMLIAKDDSYALLENYIEGYLDGISHCLNKNLREEITQWYKSKIKQDTSYDWSGHIPFHFKGKTESELKGILLDFTEQYFRENNLG